MLLYCSSSHEQLYVQVKLMNYKVRDELAISFKRMLGALSGKKVGNLRRWFKGHAQIYHPTRYHDQWDLLTTAYLILKNMYLNALFIVNGLLAIEHLCG